jgi:hypothetical protein
MDMARRLLLSKFIQLAAITTFLLAPAGHAGEPLDPAPVPSVADNGCEPLCWKQWELKDALVVHEATTCEYRVRWNWWSPPRDYSYQPDKAGWIHDYFISTGNRHGRVFWNLRTNEVWVRPVKGKPLDEPGARQVAAHAKGTIFPGLDLSTRSAARHPALPDASRRTAHRSWRDHPGS